MMSTTTDVNRCFVCKEPFVGDEKRLFININKQDYEFCLGCTLDWNKICLASLQQLLERRNNQGQTIQSWWYPRWSWKKVMAIFWGIIFVGLAGWMLLR